uniref:Uncharacterized protein n=1 Tax=Bactrocera latifrons TaxID=174628 RepID=A0A0K8UM16_BACLA
MSGLTLPHIFLKRNFSDRLLNAYNKNILNLHRANMDIQFILDANACCSYIINYIKKSNRGVSTLLRQAMEEINDGNFSIKRKLQHIGNKFVNGSEISAPEAAYNILGLHLSEATNGEIFINTSHPNNQVRILKPRRELNALQENSTNIYVPSALDHYSQRPDQF